MEAIKENFKADPKYSAILLLCGLAFFLKGVDYWMLGSIVPFIVGTLILAGVFYALTNSNKAARRIIKSLGVILILWGIARLGVELMFAIAPVTEAHIRAQFTWLNRGLSVLALLSGNYLYRKKKPPKSQRLDSVI